MASFFAFPFSIFMRIVCVDDDHCCCCCYYLFVCVFVCLKHTVLLTIRRDLSFVTPQHVSIASSLIVGGDSNQKVFYSIPLYWLFNCCCYTTAAGPQTWQRKKNYKKRQFQTSQSSRYKKRGNEKSRELCCRTWDVSWYAHPSPVNGYDNECCFFT